MTDSNPGIINKITAWYAHPFNSQGSALDWTLTLGFVIIVVFFWQLILLQITKEV